MKILKNHHNNFIYNIIDQDLKLKKYTAICTRFPPEPNGYLHIGHAKAICLNFEIAEYYNGTCNLRIDDTNPEQEDKKYIDSIKYDIKWLGFHWNGKIRYSSDYYDILYDYAIELIQKGLAYVDELSIYEIKQYRGTLTSPGKNSPYRSRSIKENLTYFYKMYDGMFSEGSACLRAKIDMSSNSMIMRDPVLYRIKYTSHYRVGKKWCIYPTYDFSHCISDAIEGITHSLCTLEFQEHRALYNWILNNITIGSQHPTQYEFSRLNLEYIVTSKRKLNLLVSKKIVDGWDDPRMPTISGLRRRGYTPQSIREFCRRIGISKQESRIKLSVLESYIRDDLNIRSPRLMAVMNPIKVIIDNLPEEYSEKIIVPNHPTNTTMGVRYVIFNREIFIDRSDFYVNSTKKLCHKFTIGTEVKLRYAYVITAKSIKLDLQGNIECIYCNYDPSTSHKHLKNKRKTHGGIIHWVSAINNIPAEFRLYEKLFIHPNPTVTKNITDNINPISINIVHGFVESSIPCLNNPGPYQLERNGYFIIENYRTQDIHSIKSKKFRLIFNRIVTLKIMKDH